MNYKYNQVSNKETRREFEEMSIGNVRTYQQNVCKLWINTVEKCGYYRV